MFVKKISSNTIVFNCENYCSLLLERIRSVMSWAASTTYHYRIFVALMFFNLLYPMIPKLTSITTNTTSLIDNIFTNNVTCLSVNGPILNDLSDHLPFLFFQLAVETLIMTLFMLWSVKIWQVSSCGNFLQHLETCFLWQLKLCQIVMFLTAFFHWMYKMKLSCYQESSVIHG